MKKPPIQTQKYPRLIQFRVTEEQYRIALKLGLMPDHYRRFIVQQNEEAEIKRQEVSYIVKPGDWVFLKKLLANKQENPSLQLVGNIGSGKTYITKQLIKHDKDRVYIVYDSHNEYELPGIQQISTDIKQSCRLMLPPQAEGAKAMFGMVAGMFKYQPFPQNYVFVVDESIRYKEIGLKELVAECRKYIQVLIVTQEKLFDFCPAAYLKAYYKV